MYLYSIVIILLLFPLRCTSVVTLHGSQGSRSPLINWYCLEQGIEFKVAGQFKNPHPFGQIPALRDGETTVFESGAILMYLADKYGQLDTPEKRSKACQWVVWANASLDPVLFKENSNGQVIGTLAGQENKKLRVLDTVLSSQNKYLLGEDFSVADVAVAAYLLYIPQFFGILYYFLFFFIYNLSIT